MLPRVVHWNLICVLGLLSCRTSQNSTPPASASAVSPSSDTTCVAFLSLTAPTQQELQWQPLDGATVPFSTQIYGAHTALHIQTQFIGDFLVYTVASMSQTGDSSTGCISTATDKTPTGEAVIPNLCPGVYRITLSACTAGGVCSAPAGIPTPYLQDAQRNPDIQQALMQVATAKSDLDQLSQQAFTTITTYYQTYATTPSPTPTRKTLLDMAQKVQNMGLGMYQNLLFSDYDSIKSQVQNGLALALSPALQQQAVSGKLPTTASGCISTQQTVSGMSKSGLALADTSAGIKQADATVMQGLGSVFLVVGGVGLVGLTYTGYQAHQADLPNLEAKVQAEKEAKLTEHLNKIIAIAKEPYAAINISVDALPPTNTMDDVSNRRMQEYLNSQSLTISEKFQLNQKLNQQIEAWYEKMSSYEGVFSPRTSSDGLSFPYGDTFLLKSPGFIADNAKYMERVSTLLKGNLQLLEKTPEEVFLYGEKVELSYKNGEIQVRSLEADSKITPKKIAVFRESLAMDRIYDMEDFILRSAKNPINLNLEALNQAKEIPNFNQRIRIDATPEMEGLVLSKKNRLQDIAKKSAGEGVLEVGTTVLLGAMLIVGAVLVGVGSSLAEAATPETTLLQTLDTWIPMLESKFAAYSRANTALAVAIFHAGT